LSVLLHGALVGVLVYGYFQFRRPPPPLTALAIDATVVSQSTLDAAQRSATPSPQPVPPTPAPPAVEQPPPPDPAAQQAAAQAEAAQKAAAAQVEAAHEQAAAKRTADQLAARQREADAAEREAAQEKAAQAKAKAAEEVAARKAAAQAQAQAQAQAKAAAAAKAQSAASQADLQRSIDAEERLAAARASGAMSTWAAQIQARIQRAWIRPPSARAGLDCTLYVTQVPGGEVVNVKLGSCNGDDAVKQSIQDAAYRASPLPAPADPSLFERNLEVTFRPTD
jgi:colicin import membrane protein